MDKQDRQIRIRLLVGPQDVASSKMHMQCLLSQIGVRPHRNLKETKLAPVPPVLPPEWSPRPPSERGTSPPPGLATENNLYDNNRSVSFGFVEKGNPSHAIKVNL